MSGQSPATVPSPLHGVKRIVCLGDSITQSGERPGGYVWLIRHYLNAIYPESGFEVINAGVSGNKCTDMLARYQADVLDKHPDLIFISVGVNDVWHGFYDGHTKGDGPLGIPLPLYRTNVGKLITEGKASGAKVHILLATLIGEDVKDAENVKAKAYNEALRRLASEHGCPLVDLQTPFRKLVAAYRATTGDTQNFLTVDGVHMNAQGNQVMAQTILTSLGVSDGERNRVHDRIEKEIADSHPHPGPMPAGMLLSEDKPATSSSNYSEKFGADQANAGGKAFDQRWCAANGSFDPNPWWQVDLGGTHSLTGIHLVFAPEDLDTWRYKVQVSEDGIEYHDVVDRSHADQYFSEENHLFPAGVSGRFVKLVFTAPTSAQNWASLRLVQVFGK